MASNMDKAHHSLIDPLIEPVPSEETGLNSHFGSTFAPREQQNLPSPPPSAGFRSSPPVRANNTGSTVETNPYRRSRGSSVSKSASVVNAGEVTPHRSSRRYDYPSPPHSASPRKEHFPRATDGYRKEVFGSLNEGRPRRSSHSGSATAPMQNSNRLGRSGSLRERYPGDMSHRPLDQIRNDTKTAHRAHHLRKKNFAGADSIDRLDQSIGVSYHHEGPYDAANLARNMNWKHSPVAAVRDSNEEALRATPRENILDAVSRHRPLEGTANMPPGLPDRFGRVLDYKEGADLMREPGGDYRRWPGVQYAPNDLKGKGEPSFSVDEALKNHKKFGDSGTEMTSRRRNQSLGAADAPDSVPVDHTEQGASGLGRSNTTGGGVGNALKKRFGSIRRRRAEA
ncbi:hypothetical protein EJ04DRAFT_537493 [Polyplosphaeria fusca]|uniref:Pal1 cell morphology n=1 Tax=Polyplosphaeria fusca TaxID=682080 RepID=A0A9P4UX79_9PLEO|nr:hypothetical protein EJ04DRAFT_537493 [Polyplosphaeria fusca]